MQLFYLIQIKDGTPVLVIPQTNIENEWLTTKEAARKFFVPENQILRWKKSGKVRIHVSDSNLVNVGDVEDAVEQQELFDLSTQVMERDEQE